jgi:hypothetical protein
MANRTIQFLGSGYAPTGTDPITISATLAGNVVYTGTIPTSYTSEIDRDPANTVELFNCELPVDFSGTVPMSITLDSPVGVSVYFEQINSNYMRVYNPVYSEVDREVLQNPDSTQAEKTAIFIERAVPPLSAAEIAIFETGTSEEKSAVRDAHNLQLFISSGPTKFFPVYGSAAGSEARSNVVINGTAQTRAAEPNGQWGWVVSFTAEESGLFECDISMLAGQE